MAESADASELQWFDPPQRALIPLDGSFHIHKKLARLVRRHGFTIKLDTAFGEVMRQCALPTPTRPETWINDAIIRLYTALFHQGHAHSVEVWNDRVLVGGLYGVSLGSAFFGESMFNRQDNTSKIALVYLVTLLRKHRFTLLDAQFQTHHLTQFGTHEVPRATYHARLGEAMDVQDLTLSSLDNEGHITELIPQKEEG